MGQGGAQPSGKVSTALKITLCPERDLLLNSLKTRSDQLRDATNELLDAIDRYDFCMVKAARAEVKAIREHLVFLRAEYARHLEEHGC